MFIIICFNSRLWRYYSRLKSIRRHTSVSAEHESHGSFEHGSKAYAVWSINDDGRPFMHDGRFPNELRASNQPDGDVWPSDDIESSRSEQESNVWPSNDVWTSPREPHATAQESHCRQPSPQHGLHGPEPQRLTHDGASHELCFPYGQPYR
jgi:hypothetical protein